MAAHRNPEHARSQILSRSGLCDNIPGDPMESSALREYATDAIRYWEPRRIVYNLVLAGVVAIYFIAGLPASRHLLTVDFLFSLFLLAVLANVAYCAAYLADLFAQVSGFRELWQRFRWVLFLLGLAFAAVITRFFAVGMFPR
jgi:hypothetical protein